MYQPEPIRTFGVNLDPELRELVERLAESNHDHWARRKLSEGWTYGAERDDIEKTNPDLVPYGQLSEAIKEFDRTSVIETLKAIVALGYEIRSGKRSDEHR